MKLQTKKKFDEQRRERKKAGRGEAPLHQFILVVWLLT